MPRTPLRTPRPALNGRFCHRNSMLNAVSPGAVSRFGLSPRSHQPHVHEVALLWAATSSIDFCTDYETWAHPRGNHDPRTCSGRNQTRFLHSILANRAERRARTRVLRRKPGAECTELRSVPHLNEERTDRAPARRVSSIRRHSRAHVNFEESPLPRASQRSVIRNIPREGNASFNEPGCLPSSGSRHEWESLPICARPASLDERPFRSMI